MSTQETKLLASLSAVCSCCGREIKRVVIVNGIPYGKDCAQQKGYTNASKADSFVKVNAISLKRYGQQTSIGEYNGFDRAGDKAAFDIVVACADGKKRIVHHGLHGAFVQGGCWFVSLAKLKAGWPDVWKMIVQA